MRQTRIAMSLFLLAASILGVYWVATAQEGAAPWPPPPVKFEGGPIELPPTVPAAPAPAATGTAPAPPEAPAAAKEKKGIRKLLAGVIPAVAKEPAKGRQTGTTGDAGAVQQASAQDGRDPPPPSPPKLTIPAHMSGTSDAAAPAPAGPTIQPPLNLGPAPPAGGEPPGPALLVTDPVPMVPTAKPAMPAADPLSVDPVKSVITDPVQQIPSPRPPTGAAANPFSVAPSPGTIPSAALPGTAKPPSFVLIKSKKAAPALGAVVPPVQPAPVTPPAVVPAVPGTLAPAAHQTAPTGDAILGMQTPPLTVEKRAGAPARPGEPLSFQIVVRNLGTVAAQQVRVEDELPSDARLVFADPPPQVQGNRATWTIDEVPAGDGRVLNFTVRTASSGPMTHGTRVCVIASAGKATSLAMIAPVQPIPTAPAVLAMQVRAPAGAMVGQPAVFEVAYSNQGPQRLSGLILRATLSDGLRHPVGQSIEADIGDIEPGATKTIKVTTAAVQPGRQGVGVRVGCRGGPEATGQAVLDVATATTGLAIHMAPATRLFVGRTGDIRIEVTNHSTKPMRRIAVLSHLPDGVEFVAASDRGNHQPTARAVNWLLDGLAPGETHALLLRVQARAAGQLPLSVTARADGAAEIKSSSALVVEGVADLTVALLGADALEAGKEAIYEVRVVNPGSAPNTNVRVEVTFAPGLTPRTAQGPSPFRVQEQTVVFEGLPVLVPQGHAVYRIAAVGQAPGESRVRVHVTSEQVRAPAMRERVARVYRD